MSDDIFFPKSTKPVTNQQGRTDQTIDPFANLPTTKNPNVVPRQNPQQNSQPKINWNQKIPKVDDKVKQVGNTVVTEMSVLIAGTVLAFGLDIFLGYLEKESGMPIQKTVRLLMPMIPTIPLIVQDLIDKKGKIHISFFTLILLIASVFVVGMSLSDFLYVLYDDGKAAFMGFWIKVFGVILVSVLSFLIVLHTKGWDRFASFFSLSFLCVMLNSSADYVEQYLQASIH